MSMHLYLTLLGGRPEKRLIEQHDIFLGFGEDMKAVIPQIKKFWPEALTNLHVDAYRKVTHVDGYEIKVVDKGHVLPQSDLKLFFLNLGGYLANQFDEFHYKMLVVANAVSEAQQIAKQTAFYKSYSADDAKSHIDDKYALDVDEVYQLEDLLSDEFKSKYQIQIMKKDGLPEDEIKIGYFKLSSFK
jgi:hypothetical protein